VRQDVSPGVIRWVRRVRIREVELPSRSLARCQLLSTDLDEGRYTCGVDFEAVSDEIVVGTHLVQTQSDPIGPRQGVEFERLHRSTVPEGGKRTFSTRY
jgi:hypothetical protein